MNFEGFAMLKKDAKATNVVGDLADFQGQICRAIEINERNKCALLVCPEAKGIGDFDFDQIQRWFKCKETGDLLIPPDLITPLDEIGYYTKVYSHPENRSRDMNFIKKMIIVASLHKGKFDDTLYFNFAKKHEHGDNIS